MKLSNSLYYPAFAATMLFFVLVFIPRKEIQKIFWFSLLWGTGLDLILVLLFKALNLYHYIKADPFDFYGSPVFINLAWAAAVMLFIHFLPARKEKYVFPLYLAMYALLGVLIGVFFAKADLIVETHWNELLRFPVVYLSFYAGYKHYQYLKNKDSETI
ncbi:MAG TPA: hypothetical protein VHY08_22020 [Bacillota bacterium]|nr:hypothetical protein [Bacillota bacterium]